MANSRSFSIEGKGLGSIANFARENAVGDEADKNGNLASKLVPGAGGGQINVVKDYKWTLSQITDEVPYVRLIEYRANESQVARNMDLYSHVGLQMASNAAGIGTNTQEILQVYEGVFPKTEPTNFSYWFPYFNQTGFELRTDPWQSLDSIGDSLGNIADGASKIASSFGGNLGASVAGKIDMLKEIGSTAGAVANASLAMRYPSFGVADRPKVFNSHGSRSITISFPLYNVVSESDWGQNRDLIYLLMSQNLFNKRDYVTGVPPVFYDIYIPGQYYCYAASMNDIKVENLGNQRLLYGEFIVPDAYQVTLTLSEMVMPSKNQFEAITNGSARKFVNSSTVLAEQSAKEAAKAAEQSSVKAALRANATAKANDAQQNAQTAAKPEHGGFFERLYKKQ